MCDKTCKRADASCSFEESNPRMENIPPKFRQNDIYKAFRIFYADKIGDPWYAYKDSKVEIPEFLIKNDFA